MALTEYEWNSRIDIARRYATSASIDEVAEALSRQPKWCWMPGMATKCARLVLRASPQGDPICWDYHDNAQVRVSGAAPEITHPGTSGWLLAAYREAWNMGPSALEFDGHHMERVRMTFCGESMAGEVDTYQEAVARALLHVWLQDAIPYANWDD